MCRKVWRIETFLVHLQQTKNYFEMNYKEFSQIFLPQLAADYREGSLPFHALVDIDLWQKLFPDRNATPGQVQWYNVKLNAFDLNDEENSLLLTFSLPLYKVKEEAKFIGLRINNMQNSLTYYILRRPTYNDDPWNLYQYNFKENKEVFLQKIQSTDSLREFKYCIERLPNKESEQVSILDSIKNVFKGRNFLETALS